MRVKFVTFGFTAVTILALVLQASPQAVAQNANKPAPARKAKPAATKNKNAAAKPAAEKPAAKKPAATGEKPVAKKPVRKKKKPAAAAMKGVPSGVGNCIKHLSDMASKDPLISFEGHPEAVVALTLSPMMCARFFKSSRACRPSKQGRRITLTQQQVCYG